MEKITQIKIKSQVHQGFIYDGVFENPESNKKIEIQISNEQVVLDLEVIDNSQKIANNLSIDELKEICMLSGIKATLYPNGSISFRKLDSSTDELKSCYLFELKSSKGNYIACIAFGEIQPTVYKAEIVSILKY